MVSNHIKEISHTLNLALKYLSYRPRTVHEMQKHMKNKGVDEGVVKKVIETLLEKQYLNDKNFAKLFIESKARNNPKSKFAFRYELKKKGICSSIIDTVLEKYDDQVLAFTAIKPKIKIWKNLDDEKFKKKMMNFLKYRGFSYDIFLSTLNHFKKHKLF